MLSSFTHDVVIVGAGPAGTACALALRHSGLRVALLDKARFPRDKVCGDAIPGPTLRHLSRLDAAYVPELHALLATHRTDTRYSRLLAPSGRTLRIRWHNPAFNCARLPFDEALLTLVRHHTTTEILENHAIRRVVPDETGVTIHLTGEGQAPLRAALVVGCDGANSVVARQVGAAPQLDRAHHCAAVRAYYQGVAEAPADTSDFYFLREFGAGYCWVFPVGGGRYNVGLGVLSEEVAARRLDLKAELRQLLATHPHLAPRFAGAEPLTPITGFGLPLGGSGRPVHGTRWLLCGDAAALIDPLQGHGIDKAVHSGMLAAEQVLRCFRAGRFDADYISEYARQIEQHIGRELTRRYRLMQFLAGKAWLVNLVVRAAAWPWLQRRLVRAVG